MPIYMEIVGAQQGKIEGVMPGHTWLVSSLQGGVSTPFDAATGQATGKRQHKPMTLVMDYGENVVSLIQSGMFNEPLELTINVYEDGQDLLRILVGGAQMSDFSISSGGDRPSESITIVFQKISYVSGNKTFEDKWEAR